LFVLVEELGVKGQATIALSVAVVAVWLMETT
jgi:hypothetical protein